MQKWEYYSFSSIEAKVEIEEQPEPIPEIDHLNDLGQDGWELVSVFDGQNPDGNEVTVFYLKRPIIG